MTSKTCAYFAYGKSGQDIYLTYSVTVSLGAVRDCVVCGLRSGVRSIG